MLLQNNLNMTRASNFLTKNNNDLYLIVKLITYDLSLIIIILVFSFKNGQKLRKSTRNAK